MLSCVWFLEGIRHVSQVVRAFEHVHAFAHLHAFAHVYTSRFSCIRTQEMKTYYNAMQLMGIQVVPSRRFFNFCPIPEILALRKPFWPILSCSPRWRHLYGHELWSATPYDIIPWVVWAVRWGATLFPPSSSCNSFTSVDDREWTKFGGQMSWR